MPAFDAIIFKKKGEKRLVTLILDEGESILESVKQGMKENNFPECKIEGMTGKIKQGMINFFVGNSYKSKELFDTDVFLASGHFKLSGDEIWGSMNISINPKHPFTGTLVRGTASNGLEVKLSYIELIEQEKK